MTKDFKASQVRTTQIIASGSQYGKPAMMIVSASSPGVDFDGGGINNATTLAGVGPDVFLFVSGAIGSKNSASVQGVTVFGGDLVFSGNLYNGSGNVIGGGPDGNEGYIQFVESGDFGSAAQFVYDKTKDSLTQGTALSATGFYSHAQGVGGTAVGEGSHAEGASSTASGDYSHGEGNSTTASGDYSHAEGNTSISSGPYSHAEGETTTASGNSSHSEGSTTTASGDASHAEGGYTIAKGLFSHAGGYYTIASGTAQTVVGKYNKQYNDSALFIIGNGTNSTIAGRNDAIRVESLGTYIFNNLYASGSARIGDASSDALQVTANSWFDNNLNVSGSVIIAGNLEVRGMITGSVFAITSSNLTISDNVIYMASGTSVSNTNGGIAIASGSDTANQALVFGRVGTNTWGAGKLDVTAGTKTDLTGMTLVPLRASRFEVGASNSMILNDTDQYNMWVIASTGIKIDPGTTGYGLRLGNASTSTAVTSSDVRIGNISSEFNSEIPSQPGLDSFFFVSGSISSKDTSVRGVAVFGGDVVISGVLHGGSPLKIGNNLNLSGSLRMKTQNSAPTVGSNEAVLYVLDDGGTKKLFWKNSDNVEQEVGTGGGGGGGGDSKATYVVMSATGSLSSERVLTAGTGVSITDGGAGGNVTLAVNDSIVATVSGTTFTGIVKANAGLSGSITKLTDGTSYIIAGNNVTITSSSNGAITINSTGGGGGSGDPDATYLVLSSTGSLSNERVITAGTGISTTDGGAGGNYTIAINDSVVATVSGTTFTGVVKVNSGVSGSLTRLVDGTSYLIAGSGIAIVTGSNGAVTITNDGTVGDITAVTAGTGLSGGGSSGAVTLNINDSVVATVSGTTFTGVVKANSGLSGSLTRLTDGTSYMIAGSNVTITTGSNGAVTIASTATGSGDPNATYLVLSATGSLSSERVLTAGTGISTVDGGAGGNYTLAIRDSIVATVSGTTFTGVVKASSGISGSLTKLTDGTSYLLAGSGIAITTGSNGAITITNDGTVGDITAVTAGTGLTGGGSSGAVTLNINDSVVATVSGTTFTGVVKANAGISGSLTKLSDGTSYLIAGSNVTVTTGTNGAVTITAGGVGTGFNDGGDKLNTTSSVSFAGSLGSSYYVDNVGTDVFFFTSGSTNSRGTATRGVSVLGGDAVVSGTLYTLSTLRAVNGVVITGSLTQGGSNTQALGLNSHAEGLGTKANVAGSHTEGYFTTADGLYSHAQGNSTTTKASYSFAGGIQTVASGTGQTVLGQYNTQQNSFSLFVIGDGSDGNNRGDILRVNSGSTTGTGRVEVTGSFAASLGLSGSLTKLTDGTSYLIAGTNVTITTGSNGAVTIASTGGGGGGSGTGFNDGGNKLNTTSSVAFAGGLGTSYYADNVGTDVVFFVSGAISGSAGNQKVAVFGGDVVISGSLVQGLTTTAAGLSSHAEGYNTVANGNYSHAEGSQTTASGESSHAEGDVTTAAGTYSHAEGTSATSTGDYSHAEGDGTTAAGGASHAEGYQTISAYYASHAEGYRTIASASYSHTEGAGTIASGTYQHVSGKYNKRGNNFSLFVIGDGTATDDASRSDILRVNSGSVGGTGRVEVTGTLATTLGLSGSLTKLTDGTSYLIAGSNVTITTGSNGAVTIDAAGGGGGGSGDPNATYLVLSATGSLNNERVITVGTGISGTDGGAGGNYTIAINDSVVATVSGTTFTGVVKANAGISGSLTKLQDGTSYLIAGSNINITSASNGAVTIVGGTVTGTFNDVNSKLVTTASVSFAGAQGASYFASASVGTDVFFYVSGTQQQKGNSGGKTSVFGGDVVVSGNLYGGLSFLTSDTLLSLNANNIVLYGGAVQQEATKSDISVFVSGAIGSKNGANKGTSVFGGDVVISGTLYNANGTAYSTGGGGGGGSGDPNATYLVLSATGSLNNERVITVGTGISGTDGGAGGNYTIAINDSVVATVSGTSFTGAVNIGYSATSPAATGSLIVRGGPENNSFFGAGCQTVHLIGTASSGHGGSIIFGDYASTYGVGIMEDIDDAILIKSKNRAQVKSTTSTINLNAGTQVLINAESVSPSPTTFTDTNFFVAGTVGSKNSATLGTAVFGGDMMISGSTYVASGSAILPVVDRGSDLGSPSKRWGNVYTGDLHLRNDRGDWTIVEEEDYLCVVNNKTGKKFKMALIPLEE